MDIAEKVTKWILLNTEAHCHLLIYIEEPFSYSSKKIPGIPVINRLFAAISLHLSDLSMEHRIASISTVNPLTVKHTFTGYGRATKPQMIAKARRLYKFDSMSKLNMETLADAIGILYCCYVFSSADYNKEIKGVIKLK